MYLFIDTSDPQKTKVGLLEQSGDFKSSKEWEGRQNQSEELLQEIDNLLNQTKSSKADISKIVVITGPGSYTGLRVGLSTANSLSYAWNIPLVGISVSDWQDEALRTSGLGKSDLIPVMADYINPPHITTPKSNRQ